MTAGPVDSYNGQANVEFNNGACGCGYYFKMVDGLSGVIHYTVAENKAFLKMCSEADPDDASCPGFLV